MNATLNATIDNSVGQLTLRAIWGRNSITIQGDRWYLVPGCVTEGNGTNGADESLGRLLVDLSARFEAEAVVTPTYYGAKVLTLDADECSRLEAALDARGLLPESQPRESRVPAISNALSQHSGNLVVGD